MESKILIDTHYNGDGQIIVKHKFNDEDVRDKLVNRLCWRHSENKRSFAVIDLYDDQSDGSCQATIRPLSNVELAQYFSEIALRANGANGEDKVINPHPIGIFPFGRIFGLITATQNAMKADDKENCKIFLSEIEDEIVEFKASFQGE